MQHSLQDKNYHLDKDFHDIIKQFASYCSGSVLDLGCGNKPYRELFSVEEYIGIDVSSNRAADLQANALKLPFRDNTFDYILSIQVLEHVPDPFSFFNEVRRVLRSGGKALITTNQMFNLHMHPHDYFRFTRFGLSELAQKSQLSIEEVVEIGNMPIRVCCKINDLYSYIVPTPLQWPMRLLTNCIFSPIIPYNTHEDYIIVGGVFKNP